MDFKETTTHKSNHNSIIVEGNFIQPVSISQYGHKHIHCIWKRGNDAVTFTILEETMLKLYTQLKLALGYEVFFVEIQSLFYIILKCTKTPISK